MRLALDLATRERGSLGLCQVLNWRVPRMRRADVLRRYALDLRLRIMVTQTCSSPCSTVTPCSLSVETPSGVDGPSRRSSLLEIQIDVHPSPRGSSISAYRRIASTWSSLMPRRCARIIAWREKTMCAILVSVTLINQAENKSKPHSELAQISLSLGSSALQVR